MTSCVPVTMIVELVEFQGGEGVKRQLMFPFLSSEAGKGMPVRQGRPVGRRWELNGNGICTARLERKLPRWERAAAKESLGA